MSTQADNGFVSILEGGQDAIESVSSYLQTVGIDNKVTLAEDCQPGQ